MKSDAALLCRSDASPLQQPVDDQDCCGVTAKGPPRPGASGRVSWATDLQDNRRNATTVGVWSQGSPSGEW